VAGLPAVAVDQSAVVVRGNFNPAIFSWNWLLDQDLVSAAQEDTFSTELITADVTIFINGSVRCQVTRDTFQVETSDIGEIERLRDFTVGVFRKLAHTPVSALGINRSVHIPVDSMEIFHAIGDAILPKNFWSSFLRSPGMRTSIVLGLRPDTYAGYVQVGVEPSYTVPRAVYISHNDHFGLKIGAEISGRDDPLFLTQHQAVEPSAKNVEIALNILAEEWNQSIARAHDAIERVWLMANQSSPQGQERD
jgi:hypothetical protein